MTADLDLVLGKRQRLAGGDPKLLFDEVHAGDELGGGMLYLQPGVHLEVVEAAVFVEKLDGAGVGVVAALGDGHGCLAHLLDDVVGDTCGGRLFDELLVASLGRAIAGTEVDGIAVGVAEHLDLDVARLGEVALHVALVARSTQRFALGGCELVGGLIGVLDDLHAASATAVGGLDGNGPSVLVAERNDLGRVGEDGGAPGDAMNVDLLGGLASADLVAHYLDRRRWRADEGDPAFGDRPGEVGVLGEEAVAGVDGIGTGLFDRVENGVGVDVGLCGGLATKRVGLVGEPDVQSVSIELAVHGDGGDAEFAKADDTDGDFATVGDQDFGEHVLLTSRMAPSDATPHPGIFANSRAAAMANGWSFTHVSSTKSTNTDLAAEARAGATGIELLVADHQSAGRGRLDRRWEDDRSGQLMFSFRTPVDDDLQVAPGAIAVAAHEAVTAAGVDAGIKWPNDLVVEHGDAPGKLAGLLSEYVASAPPCVVIGLGLNVTSAPVEGATSLAANGSTADRDDVLSMLLEQLPELLGDIDLVRDELRRRSATLGRKVRVERSGGDLVGVAIDLTAGGGLVLSVDGSPVEVSVGDVIHLRPED